MAFGGKQTKKLESRRAYSATRINTTKRLDGRDRQIYTAKEDAKTDAFAADAVIEDELGGQIESLHSSPVQIGNFNSFLSAARRQSVRLNTALTVDRTVTLPAVGVQAGDYVRVVRSAAATGTPDLIVQDVSANEVANLGAASRYAEVEFSGAAWYLAGSGAL